MIDASAGKKVIVVTGATRGLGRAIVRGFLDLGHAVAGCGRDEGLVADLARRFGGKGVFSAVDVTDDHAVDAWAAEIIAKWGAPHLLVNNAGLMNSPAPLWEVAAEEFSRVVDVNVKGPANTIRAFVPSMIDAGRGLVVNFSSGWGRSVSPEVAPYCATKFAVEGLSRALAEELPKGVGVVALNPGIVDTDMLRQCWSDEAAGYEPPDQWAKRAVPFILGLSAAENGKSLSIR